MLEELWVGPSIGELRQSSACLLGGHRAQERARALKFRLLAAAIPVGILVWSRAESPARACLNFMTSYCYNAPPAAASNFL